MKVHGPYTRKDGRQHVIIVNDDKTKRCVSYPKYLVEQLVGRELDPDLETIDHIDGDFTNNDPSNLRIVPRGQHSSQDAKRLIAINCKCSWCNKEFELTKGQRYLSNKHAGPFCSKQCSGKYGKAVQIGETDKAFRQNINLEHYSLKDIQQFTSNIEQHK